MNSLAAISAKHIKDMILDKQISNICMESHEEVISKLKFIGYIQKDEKINTRHVHRQPNTLFTKICRFLIYPDNRNNALKFIKEVIGRSFEILEQHLTHKNMLGSKTLINDIVKARQGVLNLKHTYNEDTKFCCDLDVIIEIIASKLTLLKETTPELFEESKE
jgi:hypothetical protein